jgi:hypothetical protein
MASDILGLFTTPEQYQQNQLAQFQNRAAQEVQLNPFQQAALGARTAGYQLGQGVGSALGGQDPQLQLIARSQQLARSANLADPDSLEAVAQQLANIGNMPLAITYADRAKALREEKLKGKESESKINLQTAQTEKAKKFEQQAQVSTQNRTIISGIEEKLASDATYVPTNKEIAQARFILGNEMKTRTLTDPVTGALLGTIEGLDINFSAPNLARLLAKQPTKPVEGAATSTDGVVTPSSVATTAPPVVGDTTTTSSGLKITQTPASIEKAKKLAEDEVAKVEELKRESEGFQEGLSAIQVLRGTIKDTQSLVSKKSTGYGALLSFLPESDALTVSDNTQTIKDNIALAKLKELKQQSKTGASGLGALNMKEFDAIQGIIARMNPKSANYANDLKKVDDFFARAEKLMSEQGARVEERVVNRPSAAKTPVPSGGINKEARIKAMVDRAMADPRTKGKRENVESKIRARPEFQ